MAKKPTNPIKKEPALPLAAAATPAPKPAIKAAAKKPAKAATSKSAKAPAAARTQVKTGIVTKPGPAITRVTSADIALQAYYIAERRQKLGIPGDSTSDWVEAERQLKAQAAAQSKK